MIHLYGLVAVVMAMGWLTERTLRRRIIWSLMVLAVYLAGLTLDSYIDFAKVNRDRGYQYGYCTALNNDANKRESKYWSYCVTSDRIIHE